MPTSLSLSNRADARQAMDPALRKDVRMLTSLLGQTILEQEGPRLFRLIERIRKQATAIRHSPSSSKIARLRRTIHSLNIAEATKIARAFTIYFQLVNLAEEQQRIRRLRAYEAQNAPLGMSARACFQELKNRKIQPKQISKLLEQLSIQPVLTAHPTEVKRRTTLDHLLEMANDLDQLDLPNLPGRDRARLTARLQEHLEILWHTNEIRRRPMTVADEVSNTMFYFERTIVPLIPILYEDISRQLKQHFPSWKNNAPSWLRFSSWVGGDRDGNPYVTAQVSQETLLRQRQSILRHYLDRVERIIRHFSQAVNLNPVSDALLQSIEGDRNLFPDVAAAMERYESSEIYRKKLSFVYAKLLGVLNERPNGYNGPHGFLKDLRLMQESLRTHHGVHAASGMVEALVRQVETFGFHLAQLEFRDHRDKLAAAVQELLQRLEFSKNPYRELSETERQSVLADAIASAKRIDTLPEGLGAETRDVLEQFFALRKMQDICGKDAASTYLVSMTRSASDLLMVLWLKTVTGVEHLTIVPLFETLEDLERAPGIMAELWKHPSYHAYLDQGHGAASAGRSQEIMLGYSDSNKDGGYFAANWSLYRAQATLSKTAARAKVNLTFFHGKGGTIDRGGGMSYRAIVAQPASAPGGRIKLTEQGEVVSAKYSNLLIAQRTVEQLFSAVVLSNLVAAPHERRARSTLNRWESIMQELSLLSSGSYRSLVWETKEFLPYYLEATPIKIILERGIAGSRPAGRDAQWSLQNLRAIPWVFSWVQSRQLLSAWYGIGTAIDQFIVHQPNAAEELKAMYKDWPFFKSLLDNAQASLAKADFYIGEQYADLVKDAKVRRSIFGQIRKEYQRSLHWVLQITQQNGLLENQPVLKHSIQLRNPYVDPLNYLQLRFLAELEQNPSPEVHELLKLTLHGIAFGMKSTG
ncbi:MAG: phosphoenolpyruvate carboxylase [Candidatus Omnitrophica bacterium]|nr:phosphoenolpyruvate carboxylase [Candidatus Omnitrophota bacterium]